MVNGAGTTQCPSGKKKRERERKGQRKEERKEGRKERSKKKRKGRREWKSTNFEPFLCPYIKNNCVDKCKT
jgi:hypothetical protein